MGLRSRSLQFVICVFALLAIAALPAPWSGQSPGNALGPSTAWASTTPDETLKPPPPPQAVPQIPVSFEDVQTGGDTVARLGSTARAGSLRWWRSVWTIVRATFTRI